MSSACLRRAPRKLRRTAGGRSRVGRLLGAARTAGRGLPRRPGALERLPGAGALRAYPRRFKSTFKSALSEHIDIHSTPETIKNVPNKHDKFIVVLNNIYANKSVNKGHE